MKRTWTGKKPQTRCRTRRSSSSYPAHPAPDHGVSQLTAFITSGSPDIFISCAFMVCNTFRVSSVFITVSPCCRPVSGGAVWLFIRRHQQVIGAFSGIRLWAWCTHPARTQRLSFMWNSACSAASPFFISPRPVQHRTVRPHSGLR